MSSTLKPKLYACLKPLEQAQASFDCFDVKLPIDTVATREEILEGVVGVDAIFCSPWNKIDKAVLEAAGPSLKVVATISAGYNHIDQEECKKRNVKVGYLGSLLGPAMAEFTIGLMITAGRRFREGFENIQSGAWAKNFSPNYLLGWDMMDSTIGIVGFGAIGQQLAKRLNAFDVKSILYHGPREKPEAKALNAKRVSFDELLRSSDFVVVCCSVTDETRKMFDKGAFEKMKPTSIFVNVSRGEVVDQDALYEALKENKIFGAGLDVTTPEPLPEGHPLLALNNCAILPHLGTSSVKLRVRMVNVTVENLIAGVKGEQLPSQLC